MSRRSVQPISSAVSQSGLGAAPGATHLFLDRDLSLLEFQRRVLDEARDENNPLLERVKFLSILGSNLDEFFMVRVAGHKQRIAAGVVELDVEGPHPASHLQRIRSVVSAILSEARQLLHQKLIPALSRAGIHLLNYQDLTDRLRAEVDQHFAESILPILTPLAFDPVRPFPHISNLSLNLAVLLRDRKGRERFAQVKVP
ncbi:MAG: RNA degradosome polyphosphate kinase, partial [Acidobacteria bacterium]|nr:RNA degradosome polyphosphate kinase [Acidobacteriota bacterium]